ncbi:MAG: glucokinase [Pseudomonadota bacterium]
MRLVADIGGTNARFALDTSGTRLPSLSHIEKLKAKDYPRFDDALAHYLETTGNPSIGSVALAVAGPIADTQIRFTNSSWAIDANAIAAQLGLPHCFLINDFEALAYGIDLLEEDGSCSVRSGRGHAKMPEIILGPGTGLGVALRFGDGDGVEVIPTEGGHIAFAPHSSREIAALGVLHKWFGRVSVERIFSGLGIVNLYRAFCTLDDVPCTYERADEIAGAMHCGQDLRAKEAFALFFDGLGAFAGDCVLLSGARRGVWLGGGILPQLFNEFCASDFLTKFNAKGRVSGFLDDVPIRLITDGHVALKGAALALHRHFP